MLPCTFSLKTRQFLLNLISTESPEPKWQPSLLPVKKGEQQLLLEKNQEAKSLSHAQTHIGP